MQHLTTQSTHLAWLDQHLRDLLDFGLPVPHPDGGAGYLDSDGNRDPEYGVLTYITARMVHVYSLGAMLGVPGSRAVAQQAMAGLTGRLRDPEAGGWWNGLDAEGHPLRDAGKQCYDHAFVLLGASSATLAGLDGAEDLLANACSVYETHFWDEEAGRPRDLWDASFSACDDYRGLNSSMHSVEAMLAAADATGDPVWRERAGRVAAFVVDLAARFDGRLPEHFDRDWTPQLELNRDQPDDQFKPFGATIGHGFEWARLLLHVEAALGDGAPSGLSETAVALFDRAVADGWQPGEHAGFVYTTDFDGEPVVTDRMHWVVTEAIAAADALHRRTGDARFARLYADWWDVARLNFIDEDRGSWFHQLDVSNEVTDGVWPGKPDLYHAAQATLLPRLPLETSLAAGVRAGMMGR